MVWEGRSREAPPYPDLLLWALKMLTSMSGSRLVSVIDVLDGYAREERDATVLQVFEDCHGSVYRYVRSFGLDVQSSEDVVQEVFLALFRHVGRGGDRTNLRGWLFRVAHNMALKQRARERRWARAAALIPIIWFHMDPSANAEEQIMETERQTRLQAVVMALPARDRQCVLLRAEGLRYREIASALGVSLGTVANCLARVLTRLQRADGE